ncbi:MltR family transcriptional regulator [Rubinisphaera margarita]|uniref:MltR family transcriptional regulator n=1 Tax=Rubinisphaera margarita TaxID=2909586 RepID=UPI001EE82CFB|nr:MltR family transcriptional regulator [Rubinisphaera margarita]MCG6155684.1 MltR family transcriptional regulator [Rubinisphaera margarita]
MKDEFGEEFPEHAREVFEFRFSLNAETDRGCALMVASFLDSKLEQLLTAKFVNDQKIATEHLSQSGPLGTFSARIDAAYLLGLIGENVRRDLHLIRRIRNEFGHSHLPLEFSDDRIRNRCNELFHFHLIEPAHDPRKMFVKTTISILAVLNSDLERIKHVAPAKDLFLTKEELKANREKLKQLVSLAMESETATQFIQKMANFFKEEDEPTE